MSGVMEERLANAETQIAVLTKSIEHIDENTREIRGFMEKVTGYMEKQTELEVKHQDMFAAIGRSHDRTDKVEELLTKHDERIDAVEATQRDWQPYLGFFQQIAERFKQILIVAVCVAVLSGLGLNFKQIVQALSGQPVEPSEAAHGEPHEAPTD